MTKSASISASISESVAASSHDPANSLKQEDRFPDLRAAGSELVLQLESYRSLPDLMILGIALFAAIITPSSDPYTMLAMTIPMVLFYEAAIIVGRLLKR